MHAAAVEALVRQPAAEEVSGILAAADGVQTGQAVADEKRSQAAALQGHERETGAAEVQTE